MVAFLKNRRNALIITAVMIVLSIVLSCVISAARVEYEPYAASAATRYANKNYKQFLQFVDDQAGILGKDGVQAAAKYVAQTDYSFDRKIGVITNGRLNGADLQLAAEQALNRAPFSQCDGLLLIDAQTGSWYAVFRSDFETYAQQGLQELFGKMLGESIDRKRAGRTVSELLRELPEWLKDHHPRTQRPENALESIVENAFENAQSVRRILKLLLKPALIVLAVILVLKSVISGKKK